MRRTARVACWTAAAVAALHFVLPPVVSRAARSYLDLGESGSSSCTVTRLSPFRLSARDIRIGAIPSQPHVDSVEIRFTPWGLLRGDLSSLRVSGSADVGSLLGEGGKERIPDTTTGFSFDLSRKSGSGYAGTLRGKILGGPLFGSFSGRTLREPSLELSWTPAFSSMELPALRAKASAVTEPGTNGATAVSARASLALDGCPWSIEARARAENGAFEAEASLPDGAFDLDDPLVLPLVGAFAPEGLALETLSGCVTGAVRCAKSPSDPVALWSVGVRLSDFTAAGESSGTPFSVSGGRCWLPVDGFGGHFDVKPFGVLFNSAEFGNIALGRGSFWFRSDLKTLLLTEGSVGFCGGTVRVYALHLNYERLDAGFTLMLDDIDAGELLAAFPGVKGRATGRFYGKLPVSFRNGRQIRLRDAFLYSPPGQVGRLEIDDSSVLADNLLAAGVPAQTCRDLQKALLALDYTTARMELTQNRETGLGRLAVKLEGSSKDGPAEIPVNLELNFNGELQDILNIGISAATGRFDEIPAGGKKGSRR